MLKTKLIQSRSGVDFTQQLDKFINTIGPASIQFRIGDSGYIALIVHEVEEKKDE